MPPYSPSTIPERGLLCKTPGDARMNCKETPPLKGGQIAASEKLLFYTLLDGLPSSRPGGTSRLQIRQINI